jgi:hypothetical protein
MPSVTRPAPLAEGSLGRIRLDYGARAAAYVDAFMAVINWPNVTRLYGELD